MKALEWIGMGAGIIGTLLMSTNYVRSIDWRFLCFSLYLLNNIAFITLGIRKNILSLVLMNIVYLLISLNGLRTNWIF
jgi:hypothetical protein